MAPPVSADRTPPERQPWMSLVSRARSTTSGLASRQQHRANPVSTRAGDIVEILPCSLCRDRSRTFVEYLEHLIEHLAMLPGERTLLSGTFGVFLELLHQRSILDGLGRSPEHKHYLLEYRAGEIKQPIIRLTILFIQAILIHAVVAFIASLRR